LEDLYIGMKIKMSEINIARMIDPKEELFKHTSKLESFLFMSMI